MKKLALHIVTIFLGASALQAECFDLSLELLYFKPTIDQSSFVITSSDNHIGDEFFPNGKRHLNHSKFEPGFRIEGAYEFCSGRFLDARFAYLRGHHTQNVSGAQLWDTIGFPGDGAQGPEDIFYSGTASIRDTDRYIAFDLTFNRLSLCDFVENFTFIIGLEYLNIYHRTNFTSSGTFEADTGTTPVFNVLRSDSSFWGIGPEVGLNYSYDLLFCEWIPRCFSLVGELRGALLTSCTTSTFAYNTSRTAGTSGVYLSNDRLWRINPAIDARLGLNYEFCCDHRLVNIQLGYEWIWVADSVDAIRGIDVAFAGDSIDVFSNFNLLWVFRLII